MSDNMKKIIVIFSFLILVGAIVFLIYKISLNENSKITSNLETEVKVIDEKLITSKLEEISELASNKYEYSNVLILESKKEKFGVEIPLTQSIRVIRFEGVIKAGIDFSDIEIIKEEENTTVSNDTDTKNDTSESPTSSVVENKFIINIPNSKILDNYVDTDKTVIENIKRDILSEDISQEVIESINDSKNEIEDELVESGFLEDSNEHVLKVIKTFLGELEEDGEVVFEYSFI
jgi:hypothetical protein